MARKRYGVFTRVLMLAPLLLSGPLSAQDRHGRIAAYDDWSVFVADQPQTCWVSSNAVETRIAGQLIDQDRFDVFDLLSVTFFPESGPLGQISFAPHFPYAADVTFVARFAGWPYPFEMTNGTAWPEHPEAEQELQIAMANGDAGAVIMTVTPASGITTEFLFSLDGFLPALRDAKAHCAQ